MPYVLRVEHDTPADVAELVDALVSGTSGGNIVGVQVSPSALTLSGNDTDDHDCFENFQRFGSRCFEGGEVSRVSHP